MQIRCGECHGTLWTPTDGEPDASRAATCGHCGQCYDMERANLSGVMGAQLAAQARELAAENEIDLPSAYSVLLGLMDLAQVRDLQGRNVGAPTEESRAADGGRAFKYDPAFRPAVEGGFLTARQAMERGKRDACAAVLASRHRVPMETAYGIADNRTPLIEAIRRRGCSGSTVFPVTALAKLPRTPARLAFLVFGLLAAVVLWKLLPAPIDVFSRPQFNAVTVRTDDEGRVVQVEGIDPSSVLSAYCKWGDAEHDLEPLGLMRSARKTPRLRVGILRNRFDAETLLAISIRRDRSTHLWSAGDGRSPLVAMRAPDNAPAALESEDRRERPGS